MANQQRGEVEFKLPALTFTARPTFKLIDAIERECGASILLLSGKVRAAALTYSEAVRITVLAARCADKPPAGADKDEFADTIFESGLMNLLRPVAELLGSSISTGAPTKKEGGEPK